MQTVNVRFQNVSQICEFINIIDKCDANFGLGSGKNVVDAKAALGVLALDFSGPLCLEYDSEDSSIREKIQPFICGAYHE
jgi:phosphocarrier protein HPr